MSLNMKKFETRRLPDWLKERGPLWVVLYVGRRGLAWVTRRVDRWLLAIEKRRFLLGDDTVGALYNTVAENQAAWDSWDWSQGGEEWTEDTHEFQGKDPVAWKQALIDDVMMPRVPKGGVLLEIGPGAGRWSEPLQTVAGRLLLGDIAQTCLDICRERFAQADNVEYLFIRDRLDFLPDESVDFVWSYDAFVHMNANTIKTYLEDFSRVLKPNALAVIHHSGDYGPKGTRRGWRSAIDGRFFEYLAREQGLTVIEQDRSHAHLPGDVISILQKPARLP